MGQTKKKFEKTMEEKIEEWWEEMEQELLWEEYKYEQLKKSKDEKEDRAGI